MRQCSLYNRIPARAQTALVALLYVFLCTFGMVTHTHAPGDVHVSGDAALSQRQVFSKQGRTQAQVGKRTLASSSHCAFCDWQANSQARTVAVWHFAARVTFTVAYTRHSAPLVFAFSVYSTSRAPPIA